MNSKDFNNDAEREGAADSTSAQGRPGQTFQGAGYQAPGYQNGPTFQGSGYQGAPGTYGQSGMDRFFNSIRAMNLYRAQPRVLGGVCSGISQRYGIDMTLMRILFIVAALLGFGGFLYALAWAFLPEVEDGRIHVEQALHGDFTGGLAGAIVLALFSGAPASVSVGFLPSFFGNSTLIGIAAVVAVLLIANSRRNSQNYSGYPYGPGGYDGGAGYGPDGGNGGGTDGGYGNNGVGSENYDPNGAYASTRGYDGGVGPNDGYNSTYNGSYGPNGTYNGGEGQQVFSAPPVGSNGKPIPRWQGNYNAGGPRPNYQPYQRKNWAPGPGSMLSLITLGLLVMCAIPMVLEQSLRSLVISAALAAGVMGLALAVCAVRGRHGGWISVMAVFSLIFGFMPIAAITSAAPQSALDIDWQNVRVDKSNYNYMVPSIPNFVGETTLDLTQAPAGENRTITVNSFVGQLTIKTAYGQSVRIEMDHSKGVEAATLSAYSPWQVSENGVVHTLQPTNTYNSIDGDDSDDFDDDASTPTPRNWVTASPSPSGTAVASPSTAVATPSGTANATPGSAVTSPGATASSNGSANNGTNSGSSQPFAMYYYEKSTVNGWPSGSASKLIFSSPASVQGANAGSSKGTITVKVGQAVGQVRTIESAPTSN
ncbi:PspC domain protein [Actinomyces graevenitzii F0530]|uniref:PspC domain protein n=1 Tax=Actinomyces graevenitzii F0530 TaxID=1321817 RepID=U1Q4G5_9ACTO|nr:PspC domain-containing protein [Actinomyces graevenitzii]ERH17401.1 PspC domain protein [Actinomyces graevenitzii F0530]